jgi:hypothetical protein
VNYVKHANPRRLGAIVVDLRVCASVSRGEGRQYFVRQGNPYLFRLMLLYKTYPPTWDKSTMQESDRMAHMTMQPDSPRAYFDKQFLIEFLAKHGYRTHPEIIQHSSDNWTVDESDGVAYLDLNADAVRKGDMVPERPIRVRARLESIGGGISQQWKLESAEELGPGVKSNLLDRTLPKNSPSWPDA